MYLVVDERLRYLAPLRDRGRVSHLHVGWGIQGHVRLLDYKGGSPKIPIIHTYFRLEYTYYWGSLSGANIQGFPLILVSHICQQEEAHEATQRRIRAVDDKHDRDRKDEAEHGCEPVVHRGG